MSIPSDLGHLAVLINPLPKRKTSRPKRESIPRPSEDRPDVKRSALAPHCMFDDNGTI